MPVSDLIALGIGLVAVTLLTVSVFADVGWLKRARIWIAGLLALLAAYVGGRLVERDEVTDEPIDPKPDTPDTSPRHRVVEVERERERADDDVPASAGAGSSGRLERLEDIAGRE